MKLLYERVSIIQRKHVGGGFSKVGNINTATPSEKVTTIVGWILTYDGEPVADEAGHILVHGIKGEHIMINREELAK